MNRELTGREKVMLLILSVLVMALGYYKLILEPINDQVAAYRDSTEQEQTELTTELVRAEQLKKMESAVAELRQRGDVKPIPAYDNSKALMVELHRHRLSQPHLLPMLRHLLLIRLNQKAISHSLALKATSLRTTSLPMVINRRISLMTKNRSRKAHQRNTNLPLAKA